MPTFLLLAVVLQTLTVSVVRSDDRSQPEARDYCLAEVFEAECGDQEVVMIQTARYGRMRIGRCVRTDFGFVGCFADVMDIVALRCSGRRHCSLRVPDPLFEKTTGCNAEFKSYFEVAYTCVPVVSGELPRCRVGTMDVGRYIASSAAQSGPCGSESSPWLVEAAPGQKLRFTLHDFAVQPAAAATTSVGPGADPHNYCFTYAVLRERPAARRLTVCGRRQRQAVIYTSLSNSVQVRVIRPRNTDDDDASYFLLEYQAVGCADPEIHTDTMWIRRQLDTAVIGCKTDSRQWTMRCVDGRWSNNHSVSCLTGSATAALTSGFSFQQWILQLPLELSIAVVVGLAFVVGLVVFVVGVAIIQRRQSRRSSAAVRGHASDARQFRAASLDLLQSGSSTHKYSVEHGFRADDVGGYGGGGDAGVYQPGTAAGSLENEYAYVWETMPPDDPAAVRRLDFCEPPQQQHCGAQKPPPPRGPPYASRQTSLAPPGDYETTTTAGRPVTEMNFDAIKQFA